MLEQDSKQESLRQWYLKYVGYFREEYEKLPADEKKGMDNTNNFLSPCQIEIFWIADLDYQLIIQSNFNDRPDKEIIVNGPYKPHEFHSKSITILKDKRWRRNFKQNLPHGYEQFDTMGEKIATEIHIFVEMSKNYYFTSQKSEPHQLTGMKVDDTWAFIHVGNVGELDHKQEINKTIQKIKQQAKIRQERRPTSQQPTSLANEKYDGFGVHLFPPIIIDSEHKRSIEELVHNTSNQLGRDKVFDMKICNNQIIVNKDGFVFVESKSKEDALRILNLTMAFGAFYKFPLHAVREHELVMANYDRQNLTVTGMQWNTETRRAYLIDDSFNPKYNYSITKTEIIPETIKEILSNTEKLLEHKKLSEDMRLLNDGLTHFMNSEFSPSFILGWSMIEKHYSDICNMLFSQKDMYYNRLSKLNNSNQWTIDYVLKVLSFLDKIDENSYDLLMKLKRKRNKFYHCGKQVTKDDADRCIKYAMRLLVDKIQPHITLSDNLMPARSLIG